MKIETQQLTSSVMNPPTASEKESCDLITVCANVSDEEMVERAKHDEGCFECLVERYDWKMRTYVKRITGASIETVEEIVQEVFFKVYKNIDKFDQDKKFSSWIYRIAHNEAVNRLVYENRRKMEYITYYDNGEATVVIKDSHDTWKGIQQNDINEGLKNALSRISKKYQDVIVLNYFDEKNYQEISEELKKPINTIGTMLNRGKKLLKKEMILMGMSRDVALMQMEKGF